MLSLEKSSIAASLQVFCLASKNTPRRLESPKMVDIFFKASSCQALKQNVLKSKDQKSLFMVYLLDTQWWYLIVVKVTEVYRGTHL